jgi:hypothetical protein
MSPFESVPLDVNEKAEVRPLFGSQFHRKRSFPANRVLKLALAAFQDVKFLKSNWRSKGKTCPLAGFPKLSLVLKEAL